MTADVPLHTWPADALVVLVGPSGAGKSTWAAAAFRSGQVLSSDACRRLVAGDASDQSATADAFRVLHTVARARLRRGLLTVVDATNLTVGARRSLLRLASRAGRPAYAVVFDVPLERCLAQNATRPARSVPESVVRRHHRELARAMAQMPDEGFGGIARVRGADIDSA